MDTVWTWKLPGYCAKYSFLTEPKGLTMREVERIFQLDPERFLDYKRAAQPAAQNGPIAKPWSIWPACWKKLGRFV